MIRSRRFAPGRSGTASLRALHLLALLLFVCTGRAQTVPDLSLAEALIADGRADDAYDMLAPFEARLAGDVTYDYLLARSALDSGRPDIASLVYARILAVEPDYAGVRFESGRAYMELENYDRAKQEFEAVLRFENLPQDLKSAAQRYAADAERLRPRGRTSYGGYVDYGIGYDDNVNSAVAEAAIPLPGGLMLLLDPLSLKREDNFHAVNLGAELNHALSGGWRLLAAADYRGRLHFTETVFDYHDLEARVGLGHASRGHDVRILARAGRFFLSDGPLRDVTGVEVDWIHAMDESTQVSLSGEWSRYRFDRGALRILDFDSHGVGAGWSRAFAAGQGLLGLSVNAGYETEKEGRIDGDKLLGGFSLTLQGAFTDSIGAFVHVGLQRGVYTSRNALFQVRRNDTQLNAGVGLTLSLTSTWALRPQLSWSRNRSNVSVNSYTRYLVSLNLHKTF